MNMRYMFATANQADLAGARHEIDTRGELIRMTVTVYCGQEAPLRVPLELLILSKTEAHA